MIEHAGVNINTVSVIGGGARSVYWGEILANVLERPLLYRQQAAIGAAFGAARLAWLSGHQEEFSARKEGGSLRKELLEAFPMPEIEHIIYPVAESYPGLSKKQRLFDPLYQQLKPTFHALN